VTDTLESICAERCADFGDPPCYQVVENWSAAKFCADCRRACGIEVPEPIDPNAVVRPLL